MFSPFFPDMSRGSLLKYLSTDQHIYLSACFHHHIYSTNQSNHSSIHMHLFPPPLLFKLSIHLSTSITTFKQSISQSIYSSNNYVFTPPHLSVPSIHLLALFLTQTKPGCLHAQLRTLCECSWSVR